MSKYRFNGIADYLHSNSSATILTTAASSIERIDATDIIFRDIQRLTTILDLDVSRMNSDTEDKINETICSLCDDLARASKLPNYMVANHS